MFLTPSAFLKFAQPTNTAATCTSIAVSLVLTKKFSMRSSAESLSISQYSLSTQDEGYHLDSCNLSVHNV